VRKLRYCKRCGDVFEAIGKCSRICNKCSKSNGGWHQASQKESKYTIQRIIGNKKWAYGFYDKEKS